MHPTPLPEFRQILARLFLVLLVAAAPGAGALAQNLFAPVADVNGRVVTAYELNQRTLMLRLFRAPGDPEEEALKALIDERLQLQEAQRLGLTVTPEEIAAGMAEFAGRANLTREEFVRALAGAGVSEESFRDFVAAGQAWRKVVRERFAGRIQISDREVERARREGDSTAGIRVLLSEIILPANTPQAAALAEQRAAEIARITTLPAFADAARRYSASPSRGAGGRIDWIDYANLPPAIASQVLGLSVGQVTAPISIPNAVALFQLRALEETAASGPGNTEVEYAAFFITGGMAEAERVRAEVDTCDDLYGVAKGLPPERLERVTRPAAQVPGDIGLELAKLDPNEVSTALRAGGGQTVIFLMLCDRRPITSSAPAIAGAAGGAGDDAAAEDLTPEAAERAALNAIREQILNRRLTQSAEALLAELKANATVVIR